jgi:hypothetical protein
MNGLSGGPAPFVLESPTVGGRGVGNTCGVGVTVGVGAALAGTSTQMASDMPECPAGLPNSNAKQYSPADGGRNSCATGPSATPSALHT